MRRLAVERERSLQPFRAALDLLVGEIQGDDRRIDHLAALVSAAISSENERRTTPTFLSQISCDDNGEPFVPARSIQHFADKASRPASGTIYYYLRMIEVLVRYKHPCTTHHVLSSLLHIYEDLANLERVFSTAQHRSNETGDRLSGIMAGATSLYSVIERMNGSIDQAAYRDLKRGPLLKDASYASRNGLFPRMFVCIRPSAKRGELVVSTVEFSIVRSSLEGEPSSDGNLIEKSEKIAIYNEIYLPNSKQSDRGGPASVGYVVPRKNGIYILNHLQVNAGFNFSAFSTAELEEERSVTRGILMALNRGGNSSPAMAPVVMLEPTARVAEQLGRDISTSSILRALCEDYGDVAGEKIFGEVIDYLFSVRDAEVETVVNGEFFYESFSDHVRRIAGENAESARLVLRRPFAAPTGDS